MRVREFPEVAVGHLVERLAGVGVVWATAEKVRLEGAWIKLVVSGTKSLGQDDRRTWPVDEAQDVFAAEVVGYRLVTVTMRAESVFNDVKAYNLLEKVRVGLRTATAAIVYAEHSLSIVRTSPIVAPNSTNDSRILLSASMEATFGMRGGGVLDDEAGQTFAEVNGGAGVPFTPT